ncbi:MAG: hypothetical protein R3C61_21945 [Bacteroidia bacterium]
MAEAHALLPSPLQKGPFSSAEGSARTLRIYKTDKLQIKTVSHFSVCREIHHQATHDFADNVKARYFDGTGAATLVR